MKRFSLRLTDEDFECLRVAALAAGRSINAEIIERLRKPADVGVPDEMPIRARVESLLATADDVAYAALMLAGECSLVRGHLGRHAVVSVPVPDGWQHSGIMDRAREAAERAAVAVIAEQGQGGQR